ncbi:MAG TPA: S9 family peptidase [Caulobacteraceae bacterium]|nr:S9 family peptidase [Caulobacteraceae bacterium]
MRALFLLIVLAFAAAAAAAEAPPPLSAYGRLPLIEDAALSPDGENLAVVVTDGETRFAVVKHVGDYKLVAGIRAGERKVRWIRWAGPKHLLMSWSTTSLVPFVDAPRREWSLALDFNLVNHRQTGLMQGVPDTLNTILGEPQVRIIKGHPFAFVEGTHFVANVGYASLFRVDLDHGYTNLVGEGWANLQTWLVDPNGLPLAAEEYNSDARKWTLKVKSGGGWRTATTMEEQIDFPEVVGLGRNGGSILIAWGKDGRESLVEAPENGGAWPQPIATENDLDPVFDDTTEELIGVRSLVGDDLRYTCFDPQDQKIWDAVLKAYPGAEVRLVSLAANHRRMIVFVDSPDDGPAYALVDIDTGKGVWLGGAYDAALPALASKKPIAFKAADGTPLTGYLTVPKGADPKGLPLVVFPHGGPAARDEPGFDWWAQAMASRGYAVLQVNFRGSDGFGWDFAAAGFGQFGRKMQTDLSDGVHYLAAEGVIDAKRACIVGASYGGYAALAGAALQPGVYRCAVSVAGISDLRRMVAWDKTQSTSWVERYWLRYLGLDRLKDPKLEEISPIDHVGQVTIPILLIHGKDDTVVPYEQSQLMADALQKAGKPVQFVTLNHEDHWLSSGDTRLQMLEATLDFLARNNPA